MPKAYFISLKCDFIGSASGTHVSFMHASATAELQFAQTETSDSHQYSKCIKMLQLRKYTLVATKVMWQRDASMLYLREMHVTRSLIFKKNFPYVITQDKQQ